MHHGVEVPVPMTGNVCLTTRFPKMNASSVLIEDFMFSLTLKIPFESLP